MPALPAHVPDSVAADGPDLAARGRFTRLVMALGHRIGHPLLPSAGRVRLVDALGELQFELSLSPDEDQLLAIRPVCAIPSDEAQAATLCARMLELNADREVLGDATLCALPRLGRYALVQPLPLEASPAGFLVAIDDLAELGDAVRMTLLGDEDTPPHAPDMRLQPA